jgi:lipid intermediate transporter
MDCGYVRAGFLVAVGASVRAVVAGMVLKAVGLAGSGGWRGELGLAGWGS